MFIYWIDKWVLAFSNKIFGLRSFGFHEKILIDWGWTNKLSELIGVLFDVEKKILGHWYSQDKCSPRREFVNLSNDKWVGSFSFSFKLKTTRNPRCPGASLINQNIFDCLS